ncbi:NUDIX hydrolase [Roseibium suaedae]|uniref:NUDIX domain-containing protein n=1 Tax=Roseibium suaedae TaxID=735517 RepID=A0A1M7EX55_9HYPH|nr:NUDIX hydrolase [Roseibium suaedae]SHL96253.1 NUDIX domain-containing protein [Roseibium suaedae]
MTLTLSSRRAARPFFRAVTSLFQKPPRLQIAALCYRLVQSEGSEKKQAEVLMVTSRGTGRWILPKGWPIMSRKGHKTAEIEAYEEAGVRGKASKKPFATFQSHKGFKGGFAVPTDVLVYLVEVNGETQDYPELGQRKLKWLPVEEAMRIASEPGIMRVLSRFDSEMANILASR